VAKINLKKPAKRERPQIERVRPQKSDPQAPDFGSMFEEDGDPLEDVEYDEVNLETSANDEMSEILRQIKADKKARYDRWRVALDSRYYVVLCFQSYDQRQEAIEKLGWSVHWDRFINGLDVCRRLGVDVTPIEIEPLPQRGKPHLYKEVL